MHAQCSSRKAFLSSCPPALRHYWREPRQLQLQLELSLTTSKPCSSVRWQGPRTHPFAAALRNALVASVGARVRQALAPTPLALTVHLACHDPPWGQNERRLRGTLTLAPAHPRWPLPRHAAATLLAALQPDGLHSWAVTFASTLPEKQRGFGLLHLFAYRDARFGPLCVRGAFLPGLPACHPDVAPWTPALQATYSVSDAEGGRSSSRQG